MKFPPASAFACARTCVFGAIFTATIGFFLSASKAQEAPVIKDLRTQLSGSRWSAVPFDHLRPGLPAILDFSGGAIGGTVSKYEVDSRDMLKFVFPRGDRQSVMLDRDGKHLRLTFAKVDYAYELISVSGAAGTPVVPPSSSAPNAALPAPFTTSPAAAELVKTHRNSLVFVKGSNGSGSGFFAKYGDRTFLFTNAHVAVGVKSAGFRALDGTEIKAGDASMAVGHDIFLFQAAGRGTPFEVMKGVEEGALIGDEIVVLGNAEGAGVINTITGKIVGLGPQLVEVDASFVPGNSGSPIIHLKSGQVIGVATYLIVKKLDPATRQPMANPVVRRFGYRLDSVKAWQPVAWPALHAQAAEMDAIEKLTDDLGEFLGDLSEDGRVTRGAHSNPAIRNRIDAWLDVKSRRLSARDATAANQSFLSFLRVVCQNDLVAARPRLTYDYFQRQLTEQQQTRDQMTKFFDEVIKDLASAR